MYGVLFVVVSRALEVEAADEREGEGDSGVGSEGAYFLPYVFFHNSAVRSKHSPILFDSISFV